MKRLLLTGCDDGQAPLMDLTGPVMMRYANRWGLDFKAVRQYDRDIHPMWHKMPLVLDALHEYQQVIWMDADMLVTNPHVLPFASMDSGLHLSRDWGTDATHDGMFTTACMVAHQDAIELFEMAVVERDQWQFKDFHEMAFLRSIFDDFRALFHVHPRRLLNAVPIEVHPDVPEPWQPGDWLCHATMLPLADRLEIVWEKMPLI